MDHPAYARGHFAVLLDLPSRTNSKLIRTLPANPARLFPDLLGSRNLHRQHLVVSGDADLVQAFCLETVKMIAQPRPNISDQTPTSTMGQHFITAHNLLDRDHASLRINPRTS